MWQPHLRTQLELELCYCRGTYASIAKMSTTVLQHPLQPGVYCLQLDTGRKQRWEQEDHNLTVVFHPATSASDLLTDVDYDILAAPVSVTSHHYHEQIRAAIISYMNQHSGLPIHTGLRNVK